MEAELIDRNQNIKQEQPENLPQINTCPTSAQDQSGSLSLSDVSFLNDLLRKKFSPKIDYLSYFFLFDYSLG